MFRRWPFFQRLLSWTKPHAPVARGIARLRALRLEQPARRRARAARRSSRASWTAPRTSRRGRRWRRTSSPFAERAGLAVRYDCRWTATRRGRRRRTATGSRSRRPTASTAARALVVAVGVAEPYTPPGAGMEHAAPLRRRPAGRDVRRPAGASSSASRTPGSSWRPGCCRGRASSSSPRRRTAKLSVETRTLVGVRARYVQPYEDHVLGGGVASSTPRSTGSSAAPTARLTVHLRRTDGGADLAARGRRRHRRDRVRRAAAATCRPSASRRSARAGCPVQTPWWESATRARDLLRRHDRPGREGPPEARHPGQLRRGPRGALQRPGPRRPHRPDALRHRAGAAARSRPRRPSALRGDRAGRGARAVPPARLPRPRPDGRPGRRAARRRRPAAGPRPRRRAARTLIAATLEADGTGRSTRSSTRASAGPSPSTPSTPTRSCASTPTARAGRSLRRSRHGSTGPCPRARRAPASLARRSAAAASVSCRFGKANRSLVRPELGPREERRPGHGRDTRVAMSRMGEGDVVLVGAGRGCRS